MKKKVKNIPRPQSAPVIEKIQTGIVGFDHIAEGGLPKGRATLVAGSSGSCKTIFGVEFLKTGLSYSKKTGFL